MSALAGAQQSHSPMLVLGGRAPAWRWGQGSLQEIDHVPFVRPVTKFAATAESTAEIPGLVDEALAAALQPALRPDVRRLPARPRLLRGRRARGGPGAARPGRRPGARRRRARARDRAAARGRAPGDHGRRRTCTGATARARCARSPRSAAIPVFLNGLARGCVPADHALAFSRARSTALKGADVALVVGVPMDFRLGFGQSFGAETEIVAIDRAEPVHEHPRPVAAELYGGVAGILRRAADRRAAAAADTRRVGERAARRRGRAPRGRGGRVRRRPRAAAPDAALRRAARRCSTATRS